MKLIDTRDLVDKLAGFTSTEVKLTEEEKQILLKAFNICDRAGELQTKACALMELDDASENDFAWAAIYLRYCLGVKS